MSCFLICFKSIYFIQIQIQGFSAALIMVSFNHSLQVTIDINNNRFLKDDIFINTCTVSLKAVDLSYHIEYSIHLKANLLTRAWFITFPGIGPRTLLIA